MAAGTPSRSSSKPSSRPSAMTALTIPELLTLCLEYMQARELTASALVCKQWSQSAHAVLWRCHEVKISTLLKRTGLLFEESRCMRFSGLDSDATAEAMGLEDWTAFLDRYSRRVTRLHLDVGLSTTTLQLLRNLTTAYETPLSPNLRVLRVSLTKRWKSTNPMIGMLLDSAVSPRSIMLEQGYSDTRLHAVLKNIASAAPKLRCLGLQTTPLDVDLSGFSHLKEVRVCSLSWAGWLTLAACPSLEAVYLTGQTPEPLITKGAGLKRLLTLPTLRTLSIDGTGGKDSCYSILFNTSMPALRKLFVRPGISDENGDLIALLSQRSEGMQEMDMVLSNKLLDSRIMGCLSSLRDLRVLRLGGMVSSLWLSNDIMGIFAQSLPHLRVLCFTFKITNITASERVTRKSFLTLLRHCRSLEEVELPMNLFDCPRRFQPTSLPEASTTVTRLSLGHSKLPGDVRRVVSFLAVCLPRLSVLTVAKTNGKHGAHLASEFRKSRPLL